MLTVLRFLLVIPFGFLAACLAGAFALIWPFIGAVPTLEADPLFWFDAVVGFALQVAQVGSVSLVPWAVFMAATEILGIRSLLVHAAAGLLGAVAFLRVAYAAAQPDASIQTALVVAGLAFALVYWLVAGRSAGRWRQPRPAPSPPETSA